jgi:hypothetical protein
VTVYNLIHNVQAVQALPAPVQAAGQNSNLPNGSKSVKPDGGAGTPSSPPTSQTFQGVLNGNGNCSATVNIIVSNDEFNWIPYAQITFASGTTPNSQAAMGSQVWAYYSAYVSALSGTDASVNCLMNC